MNILPLFGKRKRPRHALYAQPMSMSQEPNSGPSTGYRNSTNDGFQQQMYTPGPGGDGNWRVNPTTQHSHKLAFQSTAPQVNPGQWNNRVKANTFKSQNMNKATPLAPSTIPKVMPQTPNIRTPSSKSRPPSTPYPGRGDPVIYNQTQQNSIPPYTPLPVQKQAWQPQSKASPAIKTPLPQKMQMSQSNQGGGTDRTSNGLKVLTTGVEGVKKWSQLLQDSGILIFEVFGILNSSVVSDDAGKRFMLKDGNQTLNCIFYETDRPIPHMTRGQWIRCIGSFHVNNSTFHCISLRSAASSEQRWMKAMMGACEKALRAQMVAMNKEP